MGAVGELPEASSLHVGSGRAALQADQSLAKLDNCSLLHADEVTSKVAKEYKGPGSYAYVRLPDTVDPRGKAGGR